MISNIGRKHRNGFKVYLSLLEGWKGVGRVDNRDKFAILLLLIFAIGWFIKNVILPHLAEILGVGLIILFIWILVKCISYARKRRRRVTSQRVIDRPTGGVTSRERKDIIQSAEPLAVSTGALSLPSRSQKEFMIMDPEGEICMIDTSDPESDFYGKHWADILSSLVDENIYIYGYIEEESISREGVFSGYLVRVKGVKGFLPRSLSHIYSAEFPPSPRERVLLKPERFYPKGRKKGMVIWDAVYPYEKLVNRGESVIKINETYRALVLNFVEESAMERYYLLRLPANKLGTISVSLLDCHLKGGEIVTVRVVDTFLIRGMYLFECDSLRIMDLSSEGVIIK